MDGLSRTATGTVRGVQEDGVWAFRGIPYARDPSGSARWRGPEPPAAWGGVYEADHFGWVAPQPPPVPGMSIPGGPDRILRGLSRASTSGRPTSTTHGVP